MGLIRKSSIEEYWNSTMASQASNWFKRTMSRNRFQNILRFLYVSDHSKNCPREHPGYDPASRFRPLLNFMNRQFGRFLVPEKEICVDETLVASKGHNIMRQYIPSKAGKFRIKFWMLCESATSYILQMTVYRGRNFDPVPSGELQGTQVVTSLLSSANLLNKCYHVFCDSFFCSLNLATRLLQSNTFVTGTLRKNRPMPNVIKSADPAPNNAVYMRKGKVLCMAYRDADGKRPVRMLSTYLPAQELRSGKPKIVHVYNKNMGGVDTTDSVMKAYSGQRKNRKTWKKVLLHLYHRILHNAYILYTKNTADTPIKSRVRFIQDVVESLSDTVTINVIPARARPHDQRRNIHVGVKLLSGRKEKDCCVCSRRSQAGGRRRSRTACSFCGKGLHRCCIQFHYNCHEY
ncbi:hypothetical protein KUTeg_002887 [Tegillarca granosa]|uniref:PiggyBac transposable element-derived protein domain-containing protein n=1 Tax=Tegillarca granosa TaxID=220873 RepID=A0ABQ9FQK0_TEGGR|nr:hypothetical protein KUTeg_002887 [Tegillarca granosa]